MTPMQIIIAATRDAAHVCRRAELLGTLEVGKIADVLVVHGDPLRNLDALRNAQLVIHDGVIIRNEGVDQATSGAGPIRDEGHRLAGLLSQREPGTSQRIRIDRAWELAWMQIPIE
jgi:cytosine/adenosine deaminase-related metal-dependent hydrolase